MRIPYCIYKEIWPNPFLREALPCAREIRNTHDPLAVAVQKSTGGWWKIVGHVPRRISPLSSVFRRSGSMKCIVTGPRHYSSDLLQGGLCQFIFSIKNAEECEQLHKCITDSLSKTCHGETPTASDTVGAIEKVIEEQQNTLPGSTVGNNEPPGAGQDVKVEADFHK